MNIIFDIDNYDKNKLFFLDTKDNILMEGKFTKILYSDCFLTTIGLFFKIDFSNSTIQLYNKKCILKFEATENNTKIVNRLASIENDILQYYKILNNCKKKPVNILNNALLNGNIKVYTKNLNNFNDFKNIIKISGIWENNTEIGITYKFLEGETLNKSSSS